MQTRLQSLIESLSNIAVGFGVALLTQIIVFPWFGIDIRFHENLGISVIFTVVSIVRSYLIRRFYNWRHGQYRKSGRGQI